MKWLEGIEFGEGPQIVGPMRRVNEVFTFSCDRDGIDLDRQQLRDLGFGFRIQASEGDIGRHHVAARPPTQRRRRGAEYKADDEDR